MVKASKPSRAVASSFSSLRMKPYNTAPAQRGGKLMSLPQHGRRQLTPCLSQLPKHNHIWISDRLLNDAWQHFVHKRHCHSRRRENGPIVLAARRPKIDHQSCHETQPRAQIRHGSSVPGPLEARKRASRKSMTGLAYDHYTAPVNDIPPTFSLKSWLPTRWGSPAGQMNWEPPDRSIWGRRGSSPDEAGNEILQDESAPLPHDLPFTSSGSFDHGTFDGETGLRTHIREPGNHAQEEDHCVQLQADARRSEAGFTFSDKPNVVSESGELRALLLRMDFEDLTNFLTNEAHSQDHTIMTEHIAVIIDRLFSEAELQTDVQNVTPVLNWLAEWLKARAVEEKLTLALLCKIIALAPGRNEATKDLIAANPIRQLVFTKLCLCITAGFMQSKALFTEVLEYTKMVQDLVFALAKCDHPEMSCQLASQLFINVSGRLEAETLVRTFLCEYAFVNSGSGPFHFGLSIHRCIPLAGLLKWLSKEQQLSPAIQAATLHRLKDHTAVGEQKSVTQIDYWFRSLRLGEITLDKSAHDMIVRTLGLMKHPQLLADFLDPLPAAHQCHALLNAWVPIGEISSRGHAIFRQRQRMFDAQPGTLEDGGSYFATQTPFLSMFAGLHGISPSLAQELLPKMLYLCHCSREYSSISQIANYLRSKKLLIPLGVLRVLLHSLTSRVPQLARHLLDNDPRPIPIKHPEYVIKMIEAGVSPYKILYLLQAAVGVKKKIVGVAEAATRPIDKETNELLCRAAEAWVQLPLSSGDDSQSHPTAMSTKKKFYHIVRVIGLYGKQPEALDERIVAAMYHAIVSEPILEGRHVSGSHLQVANRILRLYGDRFYSLMGYYSAQADVHNLWLDMPSCKPKVEDVHARKDFSPIHEKSWHEMVDSAVDELSEQSGDLTERLDEHIAEALRAPQEAHHTQPETPMVHVGIGRGEATSSTWADIRVENVPRKRQRSQLALN